MTNSKKRKSPLRLNMDPDEALERAIDVDPDELDENKKMKKGPAEAGGHQKSWTH